MTRKSVLSGAASVLVGIIGPLMGGCWSTVPAAHDRGGAAAGAIIAVDGWPQRDMEAAQRIAAETPRRIWTSQDQVTISEGKRPSEPPEWTDYEVVHSGVYGQGVIRVIKQLTLMFEFGPDGPVRGEFKSTDEIIRFVSRSMLRDRPVGLWEFSQLGSAELTEAVAALMARLQNTSVAPRSTVVLYEGLGGKLYMPKRPSRGLVIHLGGLGSARYERSLLDELRRRDWSMFSVPYVGMSGLSSTRFSVGKSSDPHYGILHITPPLVETLDPVLSGGIGVRVPATREIFATPAAMGERFAAVSDDRVAEPAYFIDALLKYLEAQRPEVATRPLVLVASSGGALCAPTVAARLGNRLTAAVLIGGGANLMRIGLESSYDAARPSFDWALGLPELDQKNEAINAYLAATRLDPLRTAASLRAIPVLQVHANMDSIVPAATGLELWQAMGKPERLDFLGGHELLFFALDDQTDFLAEWIERHAPPATPPPVVDPEAAAKVQDAATDKVREDGLCKAASQEPANETRGVRGRRPPGG